MIFFLLYFLACLVFQVPKVNTAMCKTVLYAVKIAVFSIITALCLNSPALARKHKKDQQADIQQTNQTVNGDSGKNERLKKLIEHKKEKELKQKLNESKKRSRKDHFNSLSEEEKAKIRQKRKERFDGLSDEEKAKIRQKRKERFDSLSEEEKAKIRQKRKERFDSLSEEEKAKIHEKFKALSPEQKEKARELRRICRGTPDSSDCRTQKKAFCSDNPDFCKDIGIRGGRDCRPLSTLTDDQKTQVKGFCDTKSDKSACWRFCKQNPDSCVSTTPSDNVISTSNTISDSTDISLDSIVDDTTNTSSDGIVVDSSSISVDDTATKQSKWMIVAEVLKSIFGNSDSSAISTNSAIISDGITVNEGSVSKEESIVIKPEETEISVESPKNRSDALKEENSTH